MDNFAKSYKKDSEMWNTIIGFVLTVISIIISIISLFVNPGNFIIAVSVIACQIIVVGCCSLSLAFIYKSRKALNDANEKINASEEAFQKSLLETKLSLEQNDKLVEKMARFEKNLNKRINNFLTRVCDESDVYYHNIVQLKAQAKKIDPNDKNEQIINRRQQEFEVKRFEEDVYSLYTRYIKAVFEDLAGVIGLYLCTVGKPSNVSISLKLFDVTLCIGVDPGTVRIITAFRDKATYEAGEREIGGKHYSIAANCDFQLCLTKEGYIRNNIQENAEDYLNENYPYSLRYYNSTVVVPIICDYKADKNVFGYLCCDTLSKDSSVEIFDKRVSDIMYSAALTIGTFLDTVNSCWQYTEEYEKREFLTYVHDKCYKGR